MARDIIDDRFIGALHLRALTHQGLEHDPVHEHIAVQAGTINSLMDGGYEGDTTLGEVMRLGNLGIGTIQQLDGELIIIDGVPWVAAADGSVRQVSSSVKTPFAVVCHFSPSAPIDLEGPLDFTALTTTLDTIVADDASIAAIRIDGMFGDLKLRSVARQQPPYPPLGEVVAHQSEWLVGTTAGSVIGFRFPDTTAGLEVPGYHLHFIADDRTSGGHILDLTVLSGRVSTDHCEELHVELPDGVNLGVPGVADREGIKRAEGGSRDS
ncbi:MAG: acetolactate decarboxylase [Actinomycetes bacterium]